VSAAAPSTTAAVASTSAPAIQFDRVSARFGTVQVLHDVTLDIPAGSVFAVLGPNGAGKTTLLAVAAGLLATASGRLRITGTDVVGHDATARAQLGICLIPEGRGVFPSLTVSENLWMMTHLGKSRTEIEERAFARFPRLAERRSQLAGTMSGGEQQMLGLARGLTTDPAILLLDELSMGLAPKVVADLYDVVVRVATEEQLTIVFVEQYARTVLSMATRAALLAGGRVLKVGTPDEIEALLQSAYLGTSNHPAAHTSYRELEHQPSTPPRKTPRRKAP